MVALTHGELSGVQEPMESWSFCPMPETDITTSVLPNLKSLCCLLVVGIRIMAEEL